MISYSPFVVLLVRSLTQHCHPTLSPNTVTPHLLRGDGCGMTGDRW